MIEGQPGNFSRWSELKFSSDFPIKEWRLPHVPPLGETFQRLYERVDAYFFQGAGEYLPNPRFNTTHIQAADLIVNNLMKQGEGGYIVIDTGMAGGKTSTLALVNEWLTHQGLRMMVGEHETGWGRHRTESLVSHAAGGSSLGVKIDFKYQVSEEVQRRISEEGKNEIDVWLFDEAQFLGDPDLGDTQAKDPNFWKELNRQLKLLKKWAVFSKLNLSFDGKAWLEEIAGGAECVVVMAARCGVCGDAAWMTKRMIELNDGRERPASQTDPLVLVAGVEYENLKKERYQPCCEEHYDLCTEEEANRFDKSDLLIFDREQLWS